MSHDTGTVIVIDLPPTTPIWVVGGEGGETLNNVKNVCILSQPTCSRERLLTLYDLNLRLWGGGGCYGTTCIVYAKKAIRDVHKRQTHSPSDHSEAEPIKPGNFA